MLRHPPLLQLFAAVWLAGLLVGHMLGMDDHRAVLAAAGLAVGVALTVFGYRPPAEVASSVRRRAPWRRALPLMAVTVVATLTTGIAAATLPGPRTDLPPAGMARLTATGEATRATADGRTRARIRVDHGRRLEDGAPIPPGIRLWATPFPLPEGARVELIAKLTPRLPFRNPTPHPPLPNPHPTSGRAFVPGDDAVRVLEQRVSHGWLHRARGHVRRALQATLSSTHAGVARALVLGEGGAVHDADRQRIRGAGLAHVLAVSGLHVAILAGFGLLVLRRLLLWSPLARRLDVGRIAAGLGIPIALSYAAFAGGASSAWRAAITASIAWGLVACGRRPGATAVAAAAIVVLSAVEPQRAFTPGFLLSIVATTAVLTAPRPEDDGLRGWLVGAFTISTRTTLATAPIVLWCFGSVPIAGVVANVLLVPVGTVLLVPLAASHAAVASFAAPLAPISAAAFGIVCDAFVAAAGVFAHASEDLQWPVPNVPQGLVLAGCVAALLALRTARARVATLASSALLLGAFEWQLRATEQPTGVVRATFVDIGQGDAALVDLPDGRLMLIDAGGNPGGGPDPGRAALLPLLRARRRDRVDIAVLSHPHPDHYGGFAAIAEAMPIDELWDSGQAGDEADLSPTSAEAHALIQQLRARGTRILQPGDLCGHPRHIAGATIRVLAPCPGYDSGYDANDNSLVLRIDHGPHSFLFTGDAELHAEQHLLANGTPLQADVLKVGHHGSRTSTTPAFLDAVSPTIAIISAGPGNRYGHPHAEVLERLQEGVPEVYNLAETGGVIIESDGRAIAKP